MELERHEIHRRLRERGFLYRGKRISKYDNGCFQNHPETNEKR